MQYPSYITGALLTILLMLAGCVSSRSYTTGPIKTADPDTAAIAIPPEIPENDLWDRIDMTFFHQLEKPLDLNWTGRQVGRALGVANKKQADDVNVLDEPPNSSWYERRHFYHAMTPAEMARGPNRTSGPDTSGPWTVTSGKLEGAAPGFVIKDVRGDTYLLKFSRPPYEEMSSAAEVISTKILYAAGYYVPQNYITYFDPDDLTIRDGAEIRVAGAKKRQMQRKDLKAILEPQSRTNGKVRALASKYVEGRPRGIWEFLGTREGDPNDRVRHEQRRELRGLKVLSAWLNDADRRSANTLAVYTKNNYIRHYLIDFGSTLGANGARPKSPKHGQEYLYDPAMITKSFFGLGFYERPWLFVDRSAVMKYPSVGYFRTKYFRPEVWKPVYPNPAFERMTLRDGFWGAKQVMSFSDADLAAIVETAELSNPDAEVYLLKVLEERRDRIGRHYFGRINSLDRFAFKHRGDSLVLSFADLAVEGQLAPAEGRSYAYRVSASGKQLQSTHTSTDPVITVASTSDLAQPDGVVRVDIWTKRGGDAAGKPMSKRVTVYGAPDDAGGWRLAGIERAEHYD